MKMISIIAGLFFSTFVAASSDSIEHFSHSLEDGFLTAHQNSVTALTIQEESSGVGVH